MEFRNPHSRCVAQGEHIVGNLLHAEALHRTVHARRRTFGATCSETLISTAFLVLVITAQGKTVEARPFAEALMTHAVNLTTRVNSLLRLANILADNQRWAEVGHALGIVLWAPSGADTSEGVITHRLACAQAMQGDENAMASLTRAHDLGCRHSRFADLLGVSQRLASLAASTTP